MNHKIDVQGGNKHMCYESAKGIWDIKDLSRQWDKGDEGGMEKSVKNKYA